MTPEQKHDRLRILEIIHEAKASHIGSCLSVVDIISSIYKAKRPNDKVVLSAGHSAVALYVVLEREGILTDPNLHNLNVHPDRNPLRGIDVSTGSLGQGLPIALGMALADRTKNVYCVCTDGEFAEGSMWESLRIKDQQKLDNLKVYVNCNGFGAYDPIDTDTLANRIHAFCPDVKIVRTNSDQFDFLKGIDAHYKVMTNEEYERARIELT